MYYANYNEKLTADFRENIIIYSFYFMQKYFNIKYTQFSFLWIYIPRKVWKIKSASWKNIFVYLNFAPIHIL